MISVGKAKFMHHPLSFGGISSSATIINQRFLEANDHWRQRQWWWWWWWSINGFVNSCGFPESTWRCWCSSSSSSGHSIRPHAVSVLSSSFAHEVPFSFCFCFSYFTTFHILLLIITHHWFHIYPCTHPRNYINFT